MAEHIASSGETLYDIDLNNESMCILDGGTAKQTEIYEDGCMYVSSGGTASDTSIYEYGSMCLSRGAAADNTTIYAYGGLYVSSGATASNTTINGYGSMYLSKGATASNTTINEYAGMYLSKGATADVLTLVGDCEVTVSKGATANDAAVSSGAKLKLSGGTVNSVTVYSSGSVSLWSGTLNGADVYSSGRINIFDGTINDLTLYNGASATLEWGTINRAVVKENGRANICGGKLNSAVVSNGGMLDVDWGSANNIELNGGIIYVSYGGKVNSAVVSDGYLSAYNGTANNIRLESGGSMSLYGSGTKANNVLIGSGASACIGSGTVASNVTLTGGAADPESYEYAGLLECQGTIKGLKIGSGASVGMFDGCTVTKLSWTPGDGNVVIRHEANVTFGSKYSGVYVGSDAAFVSQTKEISYETFTDAKSAYVAKGGFANAIDLNKGKMVVWNGGSADSTAITNGGLLEVSSGGMASETLISQNGFFYLVGGKASDTVINKGGEMKISSGSAVGVTLEKGGTLVINAGSATDVKWTPFSGNLSIGSEAHVTFVDEFTGIYVGAGETLYTYQEEALQNGSINNNKMYVMSGGVVENTTITFGEMDVFGGSASDTVLNDNKGSMYLYQDGFAVDTTAFGGNVCVFSGGSADRTEIREKGTMNIYNGGSAAGVDLQYGYMDICRGGFACDVSADSDSILTVSSGGVLSGATIGSGIYRNGGTLYISSGAVVSNLVLEYGANVYVAKGAKVTNVQSSYGSYIDTEKGASVKKIKAVEAESPDCDGDEKNGWENKKKKTVDANVMDSEAVLITNSNQKFQFDENPMTFDAFDNYVGFNDEIDFIKIRLDVPAKLSFQCTATDTAKFTVWRWDGSKMVALQSTSLKKQDYSSLKKKANPAYSSIEVKEFLVADEDDSKPVSISLVSLPSTSFQIAKSYYYSSGNYFCSTDDLLLTNEEEYYLSVESTNAAKGGNAYYNVSLNYSTFFDKGNKDDDVWQELSYAYDVGTLYQDMGYIMDDWVGFRDEIDYRQFTLDHGARISFSIEEEQDDAAKFTIWKYDEKKDKLVSLQTTKIKDEYATTAGLLLEHGTYYFSMESTNAAKGDSIDYEVYLSWQSEFFDKGNNYDDWTDLAEYGSGSMAYNDIGEIGGTCCLFSDEWVGFGDEIDYMKFTVCDDARMSFTLFADDAVKFTVFTLEAGKNGKWKQKEVLTKTLKPKKAGEQASISTNLLHVSSVWENEYFISVQSLNAKKAGAGANYSLYVETFGYVLNGKLNGPDASALAMPEAADELAMTDSMSFVRYGEADILADASAASLAELDGMSGRQDLASLA